MFVGSTGRAFAAAAGLAVDRLAGEPPTRVHPVARFGSVMAAIERHTYVDRRIAGIAHALIGVGGAFAVGTASRRMLGGPAATAGAVAVSVGGRMLADEARAVAALLFEGDLPGARTRIRSLVGRDTSASDAGELSRAAIESVAENTVDAVTAPLFWAVVGGAPAVLVHRAINTLDAMVGHHTPRYERFGWASARLDDAANWVPARLSALVVVVLHPSRARHIVATVRRDAGQHPSPNGGIIEAAFAAALDIRLGGTNVYSGHVEQRGVLGDGRPAVAADIERSVALATRLATATAICGVASAAVARAAVQLGRRTIGR